MKRLNIIKRFNESKNVSENDAIEELCYEEGSQVIDACLTIEDFNEKVKELTGEYVIDPQEFFDNVHTELGMFIDGDY